MHMKIFNLLTTGIKEIFENSFINKIFPQASHKYTNIL